MGCNWKIHTMLELPFIDKYSCNLLMNGFQNKKSALYRIRGHVLLSPFFIAKKLSPIKLHKILLSTHIKY